MKSLRTALQIVADFQHGGRELSVGEISRSHGISKSQVSRMLAVFRDTGWLSQDPVSRAYSVDLRAYVIGVRYLSANALAREALPCLRLAADRSGFTTTLSILDGFKPLYLFGVEAPVLADVGTRMGEHFPLHASAPGKALAAFSPFDLVEQWVATYGLERVTPNTICDLRDLKSELARIRKRGYAISRGERIPGFGGLAVPVFDGDDSLAAVMGLAYPERNVGPDRVDYYVAVLHDGARQLSTRMGLKHYPFGTRPERSRRARQPNTASTGGNIP